MTRVLRTAVQVVEFTRRLTPEQRRAIKTALRELRHERGDVRALEGNLVGYYRLRVGRFRLIFSHARDGATEVIFIEERGLVYEVFEAEFVKRLKS
jgi:mRNA interferase RelE/StbE